MSSAQIQGQNGKVKSEPFYQVHSFRNIFYSEIDNTHNNN